MGKKRKERDHAPKSDNPAPKSEEEEDEEPPAKKPRVEGGVSTGEPSEEVPDALLVGRGLEPDSPAPTVEAADEEKETRDRMQLLVSAFTTTQQDQYEIFRRATFPKSAIRRIMQGVCGFTLPPNTVIAMAGIAKVYVGEIVEAACLARDGVGEGGPLQPKHIREAVRRLRSEGKVPNSRYKKVFPFK